MPKANGLQFTARVGDFPADVFAVVGFELTEGLSALVHGRLQLASTDPTIAAVDILEQPVDLVLWQDGTPLRRFTGVVNEFARGDTGHHRTRYELVIQPPLWRLGLMHNSRIFQTQTTDAIVKPLLEERGIVDSVFDLKRAPEEREYCVQHRETDLQFLERLAAEEGWHYRYQHGSVDGEEQPTLILADHHGDAPKLEPFRHLDPVTVKHDQGTGRNPRYWRDLNLEAWRQAEGAEWLKRQAEYPWAKRRCKLTPQLGKVSMEAYRKQRPQDAYPI